MSDSYAPVHHITTSDTGAQSNTLPQTQTRTQSQVQSTSDTIEPISNTRQQFTTATTADPLPDLSQVSSDDANARRASLAPTPNPTAQEGDIAAVTTDDASKSDIPPYSAVSSQNAPGKAGSVGENVMGALGYGGSRVERPKEDQGIGEKIVNFFGV